MAKLDETIANLKLTLAEIELKEQALLQIQRQAAEQQKRIVNFTLYEGGDMERALQMMEEVSQRAQAAANSLEHLRLIERKARDDVKAMSLTKIVEEAKGELAELELKRSRGDSVDEAISQLEIRISEASDLAGRLMLNDQQRGGQT